MHVIMIRHGDCNENGLTPLGETQIYKVGNILREYGLDANRSRIIASPSDRTRITAEIIQNILGLPQIIIENELSCGYNTENPSNELQGFQSFIGYSRFDMMMGSRLRKMLEKYNKILSSDDTLILCTHDEYFSGYLGESVKKGELKEFCPYHQ